MPHRGFILRPTYRIESGRPVVCLYGTLETGESFLLRDRRQVPSFWALDRHRERALQAGAQRVVPAERSDRMTMAGEPVARVEVAKPSDAPRVRDRLHAVDTPTFEADVRFAVRYLIDRGIRGSLAIHGDPASHVPGCEGIDRVFEDPEVEPAEWTPTLTVLSFDLETDPRPQAEERVLSIALWGCGAAEVLMLRPHGREGSEEAGEDGEAAGAVPEGVRGFDTEGELLAAFARRVRDLDPDVVTGWNVIDFDLRVLLRAAERWGGLLELGRGPGAVRIQPRGRRGSRGGPASASVPGRSVLDGIQLLRGAFVRMESYSLDAVAQEVLGEGKTFDAGPGGEGIVRLWHEDREALAEYNLADARLALQIIEHLELVELAVERSLLTGLPPERLGASIAAFDLLYLTELGRRGMVARTVDSPREEEPAETAGGAVLDPRPGLYDHVLVFDFRSLYPSLIRTFGIDPLAHIQAKTEAEAQTQSGDHPEHLIAPNGAPFRRSGPHPKSPGTGGREGASPAPLRRGVGDRGVRGDDREERPAILPALLDHLFPRREEARRSGHRAQSYAIKILMNSFYGVLATPACRFYDPEVSNAITSFGRTVLLWSRERFEEWGHRVLYGDTDSLFVASGVEDPAEARDRGTELAERLNRELTEWIAGRWAVESRLELAFERLYLKLVLPAARGSKRGAAKRYAGLVEEGGERKTVFTGMEVVRRDWTELARQVQRQLYERLFAGRPVEEYLRQILEDLEAGRLDDLLVYHKGLRKDPSQYTSTTPPHVRAARKLDGPLPDVMAYVVTVAGPEPAEALDHEPDYGHYLEKQVRPVAEPVLDLLGIQFDTLTGRGHQLGLF